MSRERDGEKRILRLLDGFIESKLLMTAFRLDLFTLLAEPLSRDEILTRTGLPRRSGLALVEGCLAIGLLEETDGKLRTQDEVAELLMRKGDQPFRLATYLIDYYAELYRDLVEMETLVKTDGASSTFKLRDYFKDDVSEVDPELAASYSAYMDATVTKIGDVLLETLSFEGAHQLLDLCGGTGVLCEAMVRRHPSLQGAFIDVPAVVALGRKRLADVPRDVAERIRPIAGDVFKLEVPEGTDLVTMCRSAHDWDDGKIQSVFDQLARALRPGGRVVIVERMLPKAHEAAARSLYLRSIYFLSKSRTAKYRSAEEYLSMLARAGFSAAEVVVPARDPYEFFKNMRIVVATR